jgi:hypothetical protein
MTILLTKDLIAVAIIVVVVAIAALRRQPKFPNVLCSRHLARIRSPGLRHRDTKRRQAPSLPAFFHA